MFGLTGKQTQEVGTPTAQLQGVMTHNCGLSLRLKMKLAHALQSSVDKAAQHTRFSPGQLSEPLTPCGP